MKKSENISKVILRLILVIFVLCALIGGAVFLIANPNRVVEAGREDLSRFSTFDVYPASAEKIDGFFVNSNGMTVGSCSDAETLEDLPDLIAVIIIEGQTGSIHGRTDEGWVSGFVVAADFYADAINFNPSSPEEAIKINEQHRQRGMRSIPVYDFEGEIIIGTLDV
ncbi:MAG: hypothetical protein FWF76_03665 [Oscillospiraceae bacterium]|nr:hypothetical protein [Oscillospiraceae bacterium]